MVISNPDTLTKAFDGAAETYKAKKAVVYSDDFITYFELKTAAAKLSSALVRYSHKSVFSLLPLSKEYHIALIGSMLAGCRLFPLDPSEGIASLKNRLSHFLPDVCLVHASTEKEYINILFEAKVQTIYLPDHYQHMEEGNLPEIPDIDFLHSILTSGSSGNTKLVTFNRKSILFDAFSTGSRYGLDTNTSMFQLSKPTSSLHINSFWRSILNGCTFHPADLTNADLNQLWEKLITSDTSILQGQTSILHKLIKLNADQQDALQINHLILGGEPLHPIQLKSIISKFPNLKKVTYNYSSTETMLIASISLEPEKFLNFEKMPVGFPADQKQISIQDSQGNNLPIGCSGEIVVSSEFLASDITGLSGPGQYINDGLSKIKTYKTGDIGLINQSGYLFHLGRSDRQIKINGLRIDPLMIENEILKTEEINAVKVFLIKENNANLDVLVAAVVGDNRFSTINVTERIKEILPLSHIPKMWLEVDEIPLTKRGKADLKILEEKAIENLEFTKSNIKTTPDVMPEVHEFLTRKWLTLIGADDLIPTYSIFFQGADSIHIFSVVHAINEKWDLNIKPDFIIKFPTISSQADEITFRIQKKDNSSDMLTSEEIKRKLGL